MVVIGTQAYGIATYTEIVSMSWTWSKKKSVILDDMTLFLSLCQHDVISKHIILSNPIIRKWGNHQNLPKPPHWIITSRFFQVKDASDAVRGDFNALSLLEYHLVSNSAKFTEKGQVPPLSYRFAVVSCGPIFWDIVIYCVCVFVFFW